MNAIASSPLLYPKLLGEAWANLDSAVQRLHSCHGPVQAGGIFHIRHGSNWFARLLAWLMQLPKAGEAVDTRLRITAQGDREEWRRHFAGRPWITVQFAGSDGLLVERVGLTETRFRLQVLAGALNYQSVSAALCVGRLRVPIPRWFCPKVTASEKPTGEDGHIAVSVKVSLPLVGLLIAYEGKLTRVETEE